MCQLNPDCLLKHFDFQHCMGHISCLCPLKVIQQLYTMTIIFCVWMRHNGLWQNVNILMSWALLLLLVIINFLGTQYDYLFYGCCMKVTLTCTLHPVLLCMLSLHRLHPWNQGLRPVHPTINPHNSFDFKSSLKANFVSAHLYLRWYFTFSLTSFIFEYHCLIQYYTWQTAYNCVWPCRR